MPAAIKVRPPVNASIDWTKRARPRMPYTIDGTPARLRMFTSMS